MWSLCALILGFCLDLIVGDPHWMPHPIVFIGKLIDLTEKAMRKLFPKTVRILSGRNHVVNLTSDRRFVVGIGHAENLHIPVDLHPGIILPQLKLSASISPPQMPLGMMGQRNLLR